MIRVRQVKVNIDDNSLENIKKCTSKKLNIKDEDIHNLKIIKESIDARGEVSYIYEVEIETNLENKLLKNKDVYVPKDESYKFEITGTKQMKERPIIVGSGPAGLFSAYMLSKSGYKPIIIERGEKVEDRVKTIEVLTLIIIRILKLFYQIIIKSKNLIHIFAIAKGRNPKRD